MELRKLSPFISVSPQISIEDVGVAASHGFKTIICNRPDNEGEDQVNADKIGQAAQKNGIAFEYLPVISGNITDHDIRAFAELMAKVKGPVLAYCRTGTRSCTLWALAEAGHLAPQALLDTAQQAGYDLSGQQARLQQRFAQSSLVESDKPGNYSINKHTVVIVGGGAGGQAVAASILQRQPQTDIAIVEPADAHFYQPGWTLVGGGVFEREQTKRKMHDVMPKAAKWYQTAVSEFRPDQQRIVLENGDQLAYQSLVVATGLKLDWEAIPGLKESLGQHGVTSNYRFDLAPYTWKLVQATRKGNAIFTQPPMPIKCAGAPQKAMYLSCDDWRRSGRLNDINVEFCTAGAALFGVKEYVPSLQKYVDDYGIQLRFQHNLIAVDGPNRKATFAVTDNDGNITNVEKSFDMLHVCPPQKAPDVISHSPLADQSGWVDVSPETLQHKHYGNVYAVGDVANAPNAKTAAAVRKQAPVVAENVLSTLAGKPAMAVYEGYGSCPLTVERGKIVLAEFGYGGKLQPTFPAWLVDGTKPSRLAWLLKEKMLPWLYWDVMLKGKEWLAKPKHLSHRPEPQGAPDACNFEEKK
ncbi:bifunctional protein tyrosine phosphatase family protein/NAD(P)/FAD-dependent oxidoreductase [Idiomarina aquatica]|uniref:TIGR01244 family phosphatase n=1 Tax=Idiomarina aquatica TaxID=1327752 RepID=A0AA94EEX2_9GAMM|nr:bifunctional protein tyrosine phosphatase family protein/NAD(P)/FAD-dependent oxidoreductase [Idiomarina aquatica]RUO42465.1 TIGR01244 family phosphatase [Idiomarina aquatica]